MITELNFAKLTPASFALANANDVDVGVGRSMLLNNIRHGREVDHIMTGLDPEYLPDWAALKPQYEALEHGGVTSAVNVWHRVCQDNYKALVLKKRLRGRPLRACQRRSSASVGFWVLMSRTSAGRPLASSHALAFWQVVHLG